MFRSIFTKYITTFMLIILVSFIMLGSIISSMMADYYTNQSHDHLIDTADSVKYILEKQYLPDENETFGDFIEDSSDALGTYFTAVKKYIDNVSMMVTDTDGKILISMGFEDGYLKGTAVSSDIMKNIADSSEIINGDLHGLLGNKAVSGAVLIKDAEGNTLGAVLTSTTTESISAIINTIVRAIITTCLWVMLAVLIAVYFISERVISPIKDMGKAAKSFASGKFDVRVPVRGRDETAELAVAFNNMASSLADLESTRSTFLSNVSHDLRTPMTTISGFIDGILDGTIPSEKHEYYLRMIGDEVRRLSRLVAALLDVSRLEAGERKFTMKTFDICEMARVILLSFIQKIEKKELDVEFECEDENMYVVADYDAIYQILYNICDNAVKFSRNNGKYRIKIIERDRRIFISVFNEGEGIKPEDLAHVFERFYKGDKSRGLDKTGTGLGLYIAKSIIDAHGEEIWVNSKYGENCEFVFTLKRANDSQIKKSYLNSRQESEIQ